MENWGYLTAFGAALAWGSYMVPFKKASLRPGNSGSLNHIQFQFLMALSIGVSGLLLSLVLGYSINLNPYGLLSGVLWAVANLIFLTAAANLGIARAVPVAASVVIISTFLWGGLVFGELSEGLMIGAAGIGLLILGVILISIIGKHQGQNIKRGFAAAVLAGLAWGSQLVPLKAGNVSTADFFFPLCLGIFISGTVIFLYKRAVFNKDALWESLLSGFLWNIGSLLSLISLSFIGLSKMGPISQASTLIAVLWGVFYFKEAGNRKAKVQVLLGGAILFTGVIVLGLA